MCKSLKGFLLAICSFFILSVQVQAQHLDEVKNEKLGFVFSPVPVSMKVSKTQTLDTLFWVLMKDDNKQTDSFMVAALASHPRTCGPDKVPANTLQIWVELCQKASFWKGYAEGRDPQGKPLYKYVIHGMTDPSVVRLGQVDMTAQYQKVTINNHLTLAVAFLWGSGLVDGKEVWYFLRFSNFEKYQTLQGSKELEAIFSAIKLGAPAQ